MTKLCNLGWSSGLGFYSVTVPVVSVLGDSLLGTSLGRNQLWPSGTLEVFLLKTDPVIFFFFSGRDCESFKLGSHFR